MTSPTTAIRFTTIPFQGFVFINPFVTSITGSKKLTPEDLGLTASDFPPDELATLGSIHTCDPKSLQPFESKRNAQRNACLEFGTQIKGLFLVPDSKAHDVAAKLDEIDAEFYAYKRTFIDNFVVANSKWVSKPEFKKWEAVIKSKIHRVDYLEKHIQCGWHAFKPADIATLPKKPGEEVSVLGTSFLDASSTVADSALEEVSVIAQAILRDSLTDDKGEKSEVTQKILSPIRRIRDKLDALSFADPKLVAVVRHINAVFAMLPQKGKLSGSDLILIRSLVVSLGDPASILASAAFARQQVEMTAESSQQILEMVQVTPVAAPASASLLPVEDDIGSHAAVSSSAPQVAVANVPAQQREVAMVYDDV